MKEFCRSPRVRDVEFIKEQPVMLDVDTPPVSAAIFRELRGHIPPNWNQPTPILLCRVRSLAEGWAMWGRVYWNGRTYMLSRFIAEATLFACNGMIETITIGRGGQHRAVGDAINDDIAMAAAQGELYAQQ